MMKQSSWLKCFAYLIPIIPNTPHKIAYVYLQQLKWEEAIEAELKTLKLDAQYIPALDLLAHAYGARRQLGAFRLLWQFSP